MDRRQLAAVAVVSLSVLMLSTGALAASTVFQTDFESGLPPEMSAVGAQIESVQGYNGLGEFGKVFSGNFLRYAEVDLYDTELTLTNLPPHNRLSVGFLLAVIDSWDGSELFEVRVDGKLLFSHWFQLASGDSSSYTAPNGGELSSGNDLGFSSGGFYNHDRAYDLSLEPALQSIRHSADKVTVKWSMGAVSGGAAANWQGGSDESWAIDELSVEVDTVDRPCGQPTTDGVAPVVNDCLFILRAAVGSANCVPACVCAPKGTLPPAASDALRCLRKAVGQDVDMNCPC